MENRYTGLKVIGTIFTVLGVLLAILTIILVVGVCLLSVVGGVGLDQYARQLGQTSNPAGFLGGAFFGLLASLGILLSLGIPALITLAFGQLINLLIDMEMNTRSSAQILQRQGSSPYQASQTSGPAAEESSRFQPLPGSSQITS